MSFYFFGGVYRIMAITVNYVFIKSSYFQDHPNLVELIDPITNTAKLSRRTHLHIELNYDGYTVYVPMRKFINLAKYGKIGFPLPSTSRPNAGLDYRKMLLINDRKYIQKLIHIKIARSQINTIEKNYTRIQKEVEGYIRGYINAYHSDCIDKSKKYRYATLKNFNHILDL